jgi:hypothetical protein
MPHGTTDSWAAACAKTVKLVCYSIDTGRESFSQCWSSKSIRMYGILLLLKELDFMGCVFTMGQTGKVDGAEVAQVLVFLVDR